MRNAQLCLALLSIGCATAEPARPARVARRPPAQAAPDAHDPMLAASERLLRRRSVATLAAMPVAAREDEIFGALYNELDRPKPRTISASEYEARLSANAPRAHNEGPWHVRWGSEGTADLARATRFYFDILPEAAATLVETLATDLDRRGLRRYSFKVVRQLESIDVPVAAVLYVEAPDVEAGREASIAFASAHPNALWPEEPPFTLRLASGLGMADEIGDVGPEGVRGNSFGGAMAHLIALAIEGRRDLDARALAERIRAEILRAGFDPRAPWRRPAPTDPS